MVFRLRDWKSCPIYDYILRDNDGYEISLRRSDRGNRDDYNVAVHDCNAIKIIDLIDVKYFLLRSPTTLRSSLVENSRGSGTDSGSRAGCLERTRAT